MTDLPVPVDDEPEDASRDEAPQETGEVERDVDAGHGDQFTSTETVTHAG